jgi:hypothetical protein
MSMVDTRMINAFDGVGVFVEITNKAGIVICREFFEDYATGHKALCLANAMWRAMADGTKLSPRYAHIKDVANGAV